MPEILIEHVVSKPQTRTFELDVTEKVTLILFSDQAGGLPADTDLCLVEVSHDGNIYHALREGGEDVILTGLDNVKTIYGPGKFRVNIAADVTNPTGVSKSHVRNI